MAFYPGLVPLRNVLADLYPDGDIARVVVTQAEISEQLIDFNGAGIMIWKNILSVAQSNNQVQDVIDVARKHFPKNERLVEAEKEFHATPAPDLPTEQNGSPDESAGEGAMNVAINGENKGIVARDISKASVVNTGDITGDGNAVVAGSDNLVQQAHGSNIAQAGTGGSATVNDNSSHAVFDQRGQQVETQYNVAGDYNPGDAQDRTVAIAELRKLLEEISRAQSAGVLDADAATDADYQVKKALNQAQKPDAEKRTILDHLAAANEIITTVSAATGLVTAITGAIQMIQRVF